MSIPIPLNSANHYNICIMRPKITFILSCLLRYVGELRGARPSAIGRPEPPREQRGPGEKGFTRAKR